jgi:hypothetical protein
MPRKKEPRPDPTFLKDTIPDNVPNPFLSVIPPKPKKYVAGVPQRAKYGAPGESLEEFAKRNADPDAPKKQGRPSIESSLTSLLKKKMICLSPDDVRTWAEVISDRLLKLASGGNMFAITEVLNRVDGRVTETHKIESDGKIILNFVPVESAPLPLMSIDAPCTEIKQLEEPLEQNLNSQDS